MDPLLDPKSNTDFRTIYAATAPLLLYVARQMGVRGADREDIVQHAFLKLVESDTRYTLAHAKSYLACSVRTLIIDRSRRTKTRKTDLVDDWSTVQPVAMWQQDERETRATVAVSDALAALDAEKADVLVLFYRDGLSVEEIRQRLGGKTGTITARLCRQRKTFAPVLRAAVEALA